MAAIIQTLLLALHLLAVNIASAGPLVGIWLAERGRRGDGASVRVGRSLARVSAVALLAGIALGGVLLVMAWAGADRSYWNAVLRFPLRQHGFALVELAFSAACLAWYAAIWDRWLPSAWLHPLPAVLGTTNLLYHFPPLMIVLANLAERPEMVADEMVTRYEFRALMVEPEVLAQVAHFMLASIAVAGWALMILARFQAGSAGSEDPMAQGADCLVVRGGRIALAASLLQLAIGVWVLLQLPSASRRGLLGEDGLSTTLFLLSIMATFGLLQTLAAVALGEPSRANVRKATLLLLAVVIMMTGTLLRARRLEAQSRRPPATAAPSEDGPGQVVLAQVSPSPAEQTAAPNVQRPGQSRRAMNLQVIEITDQASGATARILVSQGFNCFSWRPVLEDGPREMLRSEPDFAERGGRASGNGIPLLFPFPGRIGGTSFEFGGRTYSLEAGDPLGNAIHGFVHTRPWRVVEKTESKVVGEFHASVDDPALLERWPADFRIRVSYEVRGRELVSDIRYENPGDSPLPCGFGTHAYFGLPLVEGGDGAETIVTVPAGSFWEAERMLPTGRKLAVPQSTPLAEGLRLNEHQFDTYFTDLKAEADGRVRTRLADPASGRTLTQSFDPVFTQCVIYTPPHREAICLEPYTCVPDAMRLKAEGHETGLQILEPGESFATTITLEVSR